MVATIKVSTLVYVCCRLASTGYLLVEQILENQYN